MTTQTMAKVIHLANEVNNLFKVGLQYLLHGFDPFEFADIVDKMKETEPWRTFIDIGFIENTLEPYAKNWRRVVEKYFTWNMDEFEDPVDQCCWIGESIEDIYAMLFEGVEEDRSNHFFRYLKITTALKLEYLGENIETWAMTHKFYTDDIDPSDILDNGE